MSELPAFHADRMWIQMEAMRERPDLLTDPFLDDEPIECSLDEIDICESCQ